MASIGERLEALGAEYIACSMAAPAGSLNTKPIKVCVDRADWVLVAKRLPYGEQVAQVVKYAHKTGKPVRHLKDMPWPGYGQGGAYTPGGY